METIDGAAVLILQTSAGAIGAAVSVVAPATLPPGLVAPLGFVDFTIEALEPGASVEVRIELPPGFVADGYLKCVDDVCALFENVTIEGEALVLTLTDGGPGDADGVADGRIVDPGAPVQSIATSSPVPARSGGGALSGMALLAGLIAALRRRIRNPVQHRTS